MGARHRISPEVAGNGVIYPILSYPDWKCTGRLVLMGVAAVRGGLLLL